jgi:hypothetical protein
MQPLEKFTPLYGTRRFYTEFIKALHLFLSWARLIQSTLPHPMSPRSTHLRFGHSSGLFPSGFPTNNLLPIYPQVNPWTVTQNRLTLFPRIWPRVLQMWVKTSPWLTQGLRWVEQRRYAGRTRSPHQHVQLNYDESGMYKWWKYQSTRKTGKHHLTHEDLALLCDLFYLPFEHGCQEF